MQRKFEIAIYTALRAEQMAQNGESRSTIFTILRDLLRAKRGANRDIELTLIYKI